MEQNREEILANFQACTGLEDVAEAFTVLEQNNWDLMRAVNTYIPMETTQTNSMEVDDSSVTVVESEPIETKQRNNKFRKNNRQMELIDSLEASTSKRSSQETINFRITTDSYAFGVRLKNTQTILDLKREIQKQSGIPIDQQLISGCYLPKDEHQTLSSFPLAKSNLLTVSSLAKNDEENVDENLTRDYKLKIECRSSKWDSPKTFNLSFSGRKTICEIKNDVYSITQIPVRFQNWMGWPPSLFDDNCPLGLSGISYPEANLIMEDKSAVSESSSTSTSKLNSNRTTRPLRPNNSRTNKNLRKGQNSPALRRRIEILDSTSESSTSANGSDDEDYEDATENIMDDDMFIDNTPSKKIQPLIAEKVEEEVMGCIYFEEGFEARYGKIHPKFFIGTLKDAINEACNKPAKDRRLLAMYLHHDDSVLSNVFCTQLLCFESIIQTLEANFILWPWDNTIEANRQFLLKSMTNNLGPVAAATIKSIFFDKYPLLVIVMRTRSITEICTVIYGNVGVNELLARLMETLEVWSEQQRIEVREEQERNARELVKKEQDQAYQESLQADRAKEAARKEQLEQDKRAREKAEKQIREEKLERETQRLKLEQSLPPEPSQNESDVTVIKFRLPNGETFVRRFLVSQTLQILLNYLAVKDYPSDLYKLITSWPRRDLTTLDAKESLLNLKLCPQETVTIEER